MNRTSTRESRRISVIDNQSKPYILIELTTYAIFEDSGGKGELSGETQLICPRCKNNTVERVSFAADLVLDGKADAEIPSGDHYHCHACNGDFASRE